MGRPGPARFVRGTGATRRVVALTLALLAVGGALAVGSLGAGAPPAAAASGSAIDPFRGLGTWVDAYDYAVPYQPYGAPPPVTTASVEDMARLGVRTIYLQAAKADTRSPGPLVDDKLVGDLLVRAHRHGIQVVAWYLPLLGDLDADLAHVRALHDFRAAGTALRRARARHRMDPGRSRRRRSATPGSSRSPSGCGASSGRGTALGAIVYPAVQLELINPSLWPNFPYRKLAPYVDVWMPMVVLDVPDRRLPRPVPLHRRQRHIGSARGCTTATPWCIPSAASPTPRHAFDYERFLQAVARGPGHRLVRLRLQHDLQQRLAPPAGRARRPRPPTSSTTSP